MADLKNLRDGSFAFMCGKCLQVYHMVEGFEAHTCTKDNGNHILGK